MNIITKETFNHIERVCGKDFHYDNIPTYLRREAEKMYEAELLRCDIEERVRLETALNLEDDAREVGV